MPSDPPAPKKPRKKKPKAPLPIPPGPAPPPSPNGSTGHGEGGAAARLHAGAGELLCFARVMVQPLEWLIPGIVPDSRLCVVVGDQGAGKSLLACRLAAMATRAARGEGVVGRPPGRVLLCCPEDDHEGELPGRLAAAGADLSRVLSGDWTAGGAPARRPSLPDRLGDLDEQVSRLGVSLLVLDPVTSYLSPGVSSIDPQAVRAVQEGLAQIARRRCCTILAVLQLRKSRQGSPLDWVAGCREWTAPPRHVLTLGRDPRDSDRRVMVLTKCTEGRRAAARYYTAPYVGEYPALLLGGPAGIQAADMAGVVETDTDRDAREEARGYLRDLLDQAEVRQTEIMDRARKLGISERTLRRAKVDLGVTSEHRGVSPDRHMVWVRPEEWPDLG